MRRRRSHSTDVELNVTAMLDMAFQLLAFFILTFRSSPVENFISLRMPAGDAVTRPTELTPAPPDAAPVEALAGLDTLRVTALSNDEGALGTVRIGQGLAIESLEKLQGELRSIMADPTMLFQRITLEVAANLKYEHLMKLLDICANLKLASGDPLSGLSIVELPDSSPAAPENL